MKKSIAYPEKWLTRIDREAVFSTDNGLSGAVISISLDGRNILRKKYGYQRKYNEYDLMPKFEPMRIDTIFDLASLTKIFSTTLAFMILVDRKEVSIDDKVKHYLKDFGNDTVTIKHLLGHNSGLPADFNVFDPASVPAEFYSQSRKRTITLMPKVPLAYPPGSRTVYSDIGFIMLGIILEKVTGVRQDKFVEEHIYTPAGLRNTGYALLQKGFKADRFEASERCGNTRDGHVKFPNIRTRTLQGEVQDEMAYYAMEQISANAGLFSTASDLEILCQLLLAKGSYGSFRLCSEKTVDLFLDTKNIDASYGLGFQIPNSDTSLIYGMLLPEAGKAYGHKGWTGKCFLIDFEHNSSVLVLTNKRHSPVLDLGNKDFNQFEANMLPTSIYGGTMQLFYAGLFSNSDRVT